MLESYSVAVKLHLVSNVGVGLAALSVTSKRPAKMPKFFKQRLPASG